MQVQKTKVKSNPILIPQILKILQSQTAPVKSIDLAKCLQLKTSSEINPTLYAMQKKHLIKKINDSPPTWSAEPSGVGLMDTNNPDWQDEKVESFHMPEEQLRLLRLESLQSSSSDNPFSLSSLKSHLSDSYRNEELRNPLSEHNSRYDLSDGVDMKNYSHNEIPSQIERTQYEQLKTLKMIDSGKDQLTDEEIVLEALSKCPMQMGTAFVITKLLNMSENQVTLLMESCLKKGLLSKKDNIWIMSKEGENFMKGKIATPDKRNLQNNVRNVQQKKVQTSGPPPSPRQLLQCTSNTTNEHFSSLPVSDTLMTHVVNKQFTSSSMQKKPITSHMTFSQIRGNNPVPLMQLDTTNSPMVRMLNMSARFQNPPSSRITPQPMNHPVRPSLLSLKKSNDNYSNMPDAQSLSTKLTYGHEEQLSSLNDSKPFMGEIRTTSSSPSSQDGFKSQSQPFMGEFQTTPSPSLHGGFRPPPPPMALVEKERSSTSDVGPNLMDDAQVGLQFLLQSNKMTPTSQPEIQYDMGKDGGKAIKKLKETNQ